MSVRRRARGERRRRAPPSGRHGCCSSATSAPCWRRRAGEESTRGGSCGSPTPARGVDPRPRACSASGSRAAVSRPAIGSPEQPTRASARAARVDRRGLRSRRGAGRPTRSSPAPSARTPSFDRGRRGPRAFLGHTEHLQRRLRAREVVMAFWSPELVDVARDDAPAARPRPARRDPGAVARATYWLAWLLASCGPAEDAPAHRRRGAQPARRRRRPPRTRGGRAPSHPASRRRGRDFARRGSRRRVDGPIPAETAFRLAWAGERAHVGRRRRHVPRPGDHPDEARRLRRGGERLARACRSCAPASITARPTTAPGTGTADARGMRAAMAPGRTPRALARAARALRVSFRWTIRANFRGDVSDGSHAWRPWA